MKEKIVIVLEKREKWTGRIYGQVGDKCTDKKETAPEIQPELCLLAINSFYMDKILEWMEHIR